MDPVIEDFDYNKHYIDLSSMFLRFWRTVNKEDMMQDEPVFVNGAWTGVRKLDNRLAQLTRDGVRIKMAYINEDPAGYLMFKPGFQGMIYGIDSFWLEPPYRKTGLGRLLINSLQNQYNQGRFVIFSQIHKDNPPKLMLSSFHGWKEERFCNDRDLYLISGEWDVSKQVEKDNGSVQELRRKQPTT